MRTVWARPRNRLAEMVLDSAPDDDLHRLLVDLDDLGAAEFGVAWELDDGNPARVTDQRTKATVLLFRAPCGSGCRCAAEAMVVRS